MERRDEYHRRYDAFKSRGHPFWPYTIFEDILVALGVLLILLFLAIFVGTPLESAADPTNTAYIPRPEWYFMFLFELLKLFPAHLEWVGAVLVPALGILALLLLPFYDRNPRRVLKQRPVAMGLLTLTLIFVAAETYMAYVATPDGIVPIGSPVSLSLGKTSIPIGIPKLWVGGNDPNQPVMSYMQQQGKLLYDAQSCSSCHMLGGEGGKVGPPLDEVGKRLTEAQVHNYIEDPQRINPQSAMPAFLGPLTHQQVDHITHYLISLSTLQLVAAAPSGEPIVAGKTLFQQQCDACHAFPQVAPPLSGSGLLKSYPSDDSLIQKIRVGGTTRMPGFGADRLSDAQLTDLVAYLRSLP